MRRGQRGRARTAEQLSPLWHDESLLLQPRRQSADNVLVMTVRPRTAVDPEDPGRLLDSAGSARACTPSGTRSLQPKLLALFDQQQVMAEQQEFGGGASRLADTHGRSTPPAWERASTPLSWGTLELGAFALRRRHAVHAAKLAHRKGGADPPQRCVAHLHYFPSPTHFRIQN